MKGGIIVALPGWFMLVILVIAGWWLYQRFVKK